MAYGRITKKQTEILEYIKSQILNKGYPPSVRDICTAVNLKSTSSVHAHLETLEKNAAGQPLLAVENITSYFPIPAEFIPKEEVFMLNVKGESMVNAGIYDGDQIIVKQQSTASNGEIVVALVDDSATVKRFYKENGHIRLQPENDFMEPIIVDSCEIIGKVIGLIRINID